MTRRLLWLVLWLAAVGAVAWWAAPASATVTSPIARNNYTGNGVTTVYPYTFRILANTDIQVRVANVVKTLTTDYTVSSVGASTGGNITFVVPPANAAAIVFVRNPPITQLTDYVENAPFSAETLERNLDKLTMIAQRLNELILDRNLDQLPSSIAGVGAGQVAFGVGGGLSGDPGLTWNNATKTLVMPAGVYAPGLGAPSWNVLTTGSTKVSGTTEALRRATWSFFDTKIDDVDNAIITMDIRQNANPGAATLKKTGLHIKAFTEPDNGGDSSGALIVQTGGGNAASFYRLVGLRPSGFADHAITGSYALEVGSDTNHYAMGIFVGRATAGQPTGGNGPGGLLINLTTSPGANSGGKGILVNPQNTIYDTRQAYAVGNPRDPALVSADSFIHWQVLLNGNMGIGGLANTGTEAQLKIYSSDVAGANIWLLGNGAVTPSKFIRVMNGVFGVLKDSGTGTILQITDAGVPSFPGITAPPAGSKAACFDANGTLFRSAVGTCP